MRIAAINVLQDFNSSFTRPGSEDNAIEVQVSLDYYTGMPLRARCEPKRKRV